MWKPFELFGTSLSNPYICPRRFFLLHLDVVCMAVGKW